jgi:hypothetical protein
MVMSIHRQIQLGRIKVHFGGRWVSPPELRFWARVNLEGPVHPVLKTRCWPWTGCKKSDEYGYFTAPGCGGRAHRYAYHRYRGPIPDGLCVLHHCDNPSCVRPDHLFLGTRLDNIADMMAKGRQSRW